MFGQMRAGVVENNPKASPMAGTQERSGSHREQRFIIGQQGASTHLFEQGYRTTHLGRTRHLVDR